MADRTFKSILWLDDMRMPLPFGIEWVKNYDQFVWHLENKEFPELICLDHDLSIDEHYPTDENRAGMHIPYDTYREKTGLHCARYIVENNLPLAFWSVHSMNVQGRINIETELRSYRPEREIKGLVIPYRIR